MSFEEIKKLKELLEEFYEEYCIPQNANLSITHTIDYLYELKKYLKTKQ